jgi:hypothetical protein
MPQAPSNIKPWHRLRAGSGGAALAKAIDLIDGIAYL